MYLLYVDESGDPGARGSSHLVLTGAALAEAKWGVLLRALQRLMERWWPSGPRPSEIHLSELRNGKGYFRHLESTDRAAIEAELCRLVTEQLDSELRAFCVFADKAAWFRANPGRSGEDLYLALFEDLTSRFDLFLRRRAAMGAASKGIVIADPHKDVLSRALRRQHRSAQLHSNRWMSPHEQIVETVFFVSSQDSPGLQVADLFSYAVWRLVSAGDEAAARELAPCFDREPLSASLNPGKWHGVKHYGLDAATLARVESIWPR
jgi:hypothetical protein